MTMLRIFRTGKVLKEYNDPLHHYIYALNMDLDDCMLDEF